MDSPLVAYDGVARKVRRADDVLLVEKIMEARKNQDPWKVIEFMVEAWAKKAPEEFNAFKVHLQDTRSGLDDRKFGTTSSGKDMDRRLTIVFPQDLMYMIRSVYKSDELPMDRRFFDEFGKRFRIFQIPEKL